MDGVTVGNWMRDATDVELWDFLRRLTNRCGERELDAIKRARKGIKYAAKQREATLMRERAAERKRTEHIRVARAYDLACQRALSPAPLGSGQEE